MAEKKYVIDNPALMAEWDWKKNDELGFNPKTLTLGSGKKIWWKCEKGHEWQASIKSRIEGNGCPYCSGRYAIKGENDLATVNPPLSSEWNYEKNNGLAPFDVMPNSHKKVWWKCENGHEWQATIDSRNRGNRCPSCSGRRAVKGFNDLSSVNPILAEEWNYKKNHNLKPSNILPTSNKKVWWLCKKGHEWQALISNRTKGSGCPICHSERNTSFPEYALIYYFKKYAIKAIHSYKKMGYELDIYIPSKKIAIEYDGYFWHKNRIKKDIEKNNKCKQDGIKLYRIREGIPTLNDSSIDYIIDKNQKDLSKIIQKILCEIIEIDVDVDLKRDFIAIENLREYMEKTDSLLFTNITLVKEWNYGKNGNLKPEYFTANSKKKVWWKCNKGHEWQAVIGSRNNGVGCPYCSGRYAIKGKNDLATINSSLAKEWNHEKNGNLIPEDVTANSGKKVWWKCKKGHAWEATIANRNKGTACPYCSGRRKT